MMTNIFVLVCWIEYDTFLRYMLIIELFSNFLIQKNIGKLTTFDANGFREKSSIEIQKTDLYYDNFCSNSKIGSV